jgi:nitrogen fixation protein NifU and related proteins
VAKYPARVKCALLGWMAFKAALAEARPSDEALAEARPLDDDDALAQASNDVEEHR